MKLFPEDPRRRRATLLVLVGVAVAVLTITLLRREERMHARMEGFASDLLDCRGDRILSQLFEEEVAANELTAQRMEAVCREVVEPTIRMSRAGKLQIQATEGMGMAILPLKSQSNNSSAFGFGLYRTDQGTRTTLRSLLYSSWIGRYRLENDAEYNSDTVVRAVIQGYDRDRKILEENGVRWIGFEHEDSGVVELKEIADVVRRAREGLAGPGP